MLELIYKLPTWISKQKPHLDKNNLHAHIYPRLRLKQENRLKFLINSQPKTSSKQQRALNFAPPCFLTYALLSASYCSCAVEVSADNFLRDCFASCENIVLISFKRMYGK